jgi:hypothetical protein
VNKAVRAAVMARADGRCEACKAAPAEEADHFRGRARSETLETVWMLCAGPSGCHRRKTDNVGGRIEWLTTFARHCAVHRYFETLDWCLKEIAWVWAKNRGAA